MDTYTRNIIITAVVGLAVLGLAGYFFSDDIAARAAQREVRAVVADFGTHLQKVSLLSPEASSTIAAEYGPYATPELLLVWQKDLAHTPGRRTSSPWPDRIEITQLTPQGAGYIVQGAVILMTSEEVERGDNAGIIPVYLQVIPQEGKWLIAAYQEIATTTFAD